MLFSACAGMLVDIRTKVAAGIKARRTLAQTKASQPTARYGMPDGFIKPDQFIEAGYNSLRNPPKRAHVHGGRKPHRH